MPNSYKTLSDHLLCAADNKVLTITLNRPDSMNALRPEMFDGIKMLVLQAEKDPDISVIVIEGAGRAFSAGVDLKVLKGFDPKAGKIGDIFDKPAAEAWSTIRNSSCPVIAKVHGAVLQEH